MQSSGFIINPISYYPVYSTNFTYFLRKNIFYKHFIDIKILCLYNLQEHFPTHLLKMYKYVLLLLLLLIFYHFVVFVIFFLCSYILVKCDYSW